VACGYLIEKKLKKFAHYYNYCQHVSRDFVEVEATLEMLEKVYSIRKLDKSDDDVENPLKMEKVENACEAFERLDAFLEQKRGKSGSPLAYVAAVKIEDATIATVGHPTFVSEMIARTSHEAPAFHCQHDNMEVWRALHHMLHGGPGWNWISGYKATMNGRAAYLAAKGHYLGTSFTVTGGLPV
jgi:hypothetical protein